jgi:hypothetical protein
VSTRRFWRKWWREAGAPGELAQREVALRFLSLVGPAQEPLFKIGITAAHRVEQRGSEYSHKYRGPMWGIEPLWLGSHREAAWLERMLIDYCAWGMGEFVRLRGRCLNERRGGAGPAGVAIFHCVYVVRWDPTREMLSQVRLTKRQWKDPSFDDWLTDRLMGRCVAVDPSALGTGAR